MNDTRAILFDLDGTITDSGEGIIASYIYAFEKMSINPIPSREQVAAFVGPPIRGNMVSIVGEDRLEEAMEHYFHNTLVNNAAVQQTTIYDGIERALKSLKASGKQLFVCTAKRQDIATQVLEHFGLAHLFTEIFGAEPDGSGAQKSRIIGLAMDKYNLNPATTVMIGDRSHDIEGGKFHGLSTIGVMWGYAQEGELDKVGADRIIQKPDELSEVFA